MDKYTMGFKFRIYPNHAQQELINRTLGCCRFVFNHFLAIRRDEWTANHKSVTYNQTSAMLTDLKRYEEYSWLKGHSIPEFLQTPSKIPTLQIQA